MKLFAKLCCICVLILICGLAHGQNLFLDFNGKDTFIPGFEQNGQGITLAWSATGGVSDVSNAAGGGVVSSGSGQVTAEHKGAPTFSLDDTLSYTYSVDVQLNSVGNVGAPIISLTLGEKGLLGSTGQGLTATVENFDGSHFGVIFTRHDPTDVSSGAVENGNLPALHDWVKVSLIIQEINVATGEFQYTVRINNLGPTGVGSTSNIGNASGTFVDASLAGKTAANWLPIWGTSVSGNNFDNFAVGITDFERGNLVVAKGDAAPGITNAVFSVLGNPTIAGNSVAFQARVIGTTKDAGISSSNNSGIWSYQFGKSGALVAQTGKTSATAPGTNGAAFATLSDPVASKNALGFYATLISGTGDATSKNGAGVWTQNGGPLSNYVRKGDAAPGLTDATISAINQFGLDQNGAAPILGTASGPGLSSSNNLCAWLPDSNGALQLAYQKNGTFDGLKVTFQAYTPQKLVIGQSRSVDPVEGHGCAILRDKAGEALALATPKGIATAGASGFTEVSALRTGTPAPGSSGSSAPTIKTFGLPAVDAAGTLAFSYTLTGGGVKSGDNFGLALLPKGGAVELLAATGAAAPGATGSVFSKLSAPALCNGFTGPGEIAFVGSLKPGVGDTEKNGSNSQGIWSTYAGALDLYIRQGAATQLGGEFASFEEIAIAEDLGIIFRAKTSGTPSYANQIIGYCFAPGQFEIVAQTGALVQVENTMKTVKSLQIFPIARNSMGQTRSFDANLGDFVYTATFTDGTWALFVVFFS